MRRRRSRHGISREFLCSLVVGFLTGYIASYTVLIVLCRRQEATCRNRMCPSNELSCDPDIPSERLVFIGVMTTRKYLKSRADAIYKTWGASVPGRLVFFVGEGEHYDTSLPVIVLSDVIDDVYPPQRKSFEMLRYMGNHHGNDFSWFIRLDDDIYMNIPKLKLFLRSINSSKTLYIGHPGTGKSNERGQLGLNENRPYCMGGPGVILSGTALRELSPHLLGCMNTTVTSHEDSELGRCVDHVTGMSCTQAKEFAELFYQNYNEKSGLWTNGLKAGQLASISFHPIKQAKYMFGFHALQLAHMVRHKTRQLDHLKKEISEFSKHGTIIIDVKVPDGKISPHEFDDGAPWACINAYDVYSLDADSLKDSIHHRGRVFGLSDARHALWRYLTHQRHIKRLRILQVSYQRVTSRIGLESVLVTIDHNANRITFRIVQRFDPIYFREIPSRTHLGRSL